MFENTQNVGMYKCKSCGRMIQMENSCEKPIRCPVCGNNEVIAKIAYLFAERLLKGGIE
ncbi:hypothetical protein [Pseudothermotoga sp.]|uniref:hypothetical protein n=1 Tax=Pseudothermotoga sp. TaxID=2033661 RepID=UPI00257D2CE7|nr:hypothetical protein [Pseudothermotoga sp.]